MPEYSYRREDGTVFTMRQKFSDDPLTVDPETGQKVKRIVHAAGIIFKGSGFYVNDSKKASKHSLSPVANENGSSEKEASTTSESKSDTDSTKTDTKSTETSTAKKETATSSSSDSS